MSEHWLSHSCAAGPPPYKTMNEYDIAANVAIHLGTEKFRGRLTARQQRAIFGRYYFGRKQITVDPSGQGKVTASRTVCFGTDFEIEEYTFAELAAR